MRLIDADALEYEILHEDVEVATHKCKDYESYINGANQFRYQSKNAINRSPTIDINTEVAREIFAEIKQGLEKLSNAHREKSNYSGVVHTIQARSIVISLENKYTKEGVGG